MGQSKTDATRTMLLLGLSNMMGLSMCFLGLLVHEGLVFIAGVGVCAVPMLYFPIKIWRSRL